MPKLKSNRSAAKRFKETAKGGFKHRAANRNHILTKKKPKRKDQLRGMRMVKKCDVGSIVQMLAGN